MEWQINADFDPGDETIHFGTRAYAESEGCIYEITTVATFQNEEEISTAPSFNFGLISNGAMCVCVGNTLTVFAEESSSSVLFNMAFDARIDAFTSSVDGNFLIVGLSNGFIQFLHIPSEGDPVYVKKLPVPTKGGCAFVKIIVDQNFPQDVLFVGASGDVMNIFNIEFSMLHSALENQRNDQIKEVVSQISSSPFCGASTIAPIRSVSTLKWNDQLVLFAAGEGIASLATGWGSSSNDQEIRWQENPSASTLLKLESTNDDEVFVALSATGQLISVCPYTLLMRKHQWKNPNAIVDFKLVGTSLSEAMVIAVTSSIKQEQSHLCMFSYPDFKEKFSLPIGNSSMLSSTICNVEDIHFLEFGCDKASQTSTISLKAATQTVPKFRLERLLMRKKFEAAEALAANFGLNMAPIHIARVQCFLDQMQPWNQNKIHTSEDNKELLKSILSELDKISDLDFVTNCCVNAVPPDYHVAHSLLEYAQHRLELFFVNNPELESKVYELSENVCGSILRLETLNLLKSSWDVEDWLVFSRVDLLREVQTWIKQGALLEASVIWSRHKSSFKANLGDELIVDYLLEDIPSWVSLDNVLDWLAHLLPTLLEVQPNTLPKIVSWILTKILVLERSHTREWPKIGLDYCEKTLSLLTSQNLASPFVGVEASPLRPLVVLRSALANLHSLQSEYYIYLSLEDFSKFPSDVALLLLDSVDVGLLSSFITKYFNNYVLDHKLESDDIISQYIMIILDSSDGWWHWQEAPWECRISTLIPHITNFKIRLQCIVATLETAPVPWSSTISSLAEDGLKLKHPMVSQIREKQNQVGTNLILKKYGLRAHINKIDRSKLLKYIVKQNHPDMLMDLEELAQKSVEDYTTIIMQLFYFGNTSKALEILKTLPQDMIVLICPWLIHETSLMSTVVECEIENQLEFISAIAICHEAAKESKPPGMSHIEDLHNPRDLPLSLEELKNKFLLKRDFGRSLSVTEMGSIACRHAVLKEIVQDLIMEVIENEIPDERNARLYRQAVYVARLLMMPSAESYMELVEQALNCADVKLAAYIVGCFDSLKDLPARVHEKLLSLPSLFFNKFYDLNAKEAVREASTALNNIASCVCCYCDSDMLFEAVRAFGWTMIWRHISGQQEMSLIGHRDAFMNWRFTPLYKDPGLAGFLNGSYLCDFLYSIFSIINSSADVQNEFVSKLPDYVKKLQDDQHDVAIIMILSQVSSFHHRSSNTMSANLVAKIHETLLGCFQALLMKVAGSRSFDKYLGLGLLSYMGQARALNLLEEMNKSAYVDFHRLKAFSCLGAIVTGIWKISDRHSFFKQISIQSTWGLRLSELGIQAKELLRTKSDSDTILQKLIGSKTVTTSLLLSLCMDYQLDYQDVLLQHLCSILLSWDPDPIMRVNSDGTRDVIERNTQQQLLEQCWEIQKNIKNKQLLCTTLASTWQKVNFYHHEVFIVILEILERHGVEDKSNKRLITTFLKRYRRVKPPDQLEEEFWIELFPSLFGLPPMSEFRLPFSRRITDAPFQSISREINLSTYKSWLSIAPALDIPKDKICIKAVHQTVTEEFSNYQSSLEWCESPKNEALIESVADCVSQMDDVGQAAATLYFFMNKIPSGFDQVRVGNICMQYADIILKETGEREYKLKIEKKYFHLATLQTLHVYGLGQPCYTQLVQSPTELIQLLYQHSSILDLCRGVASHSLDINAAVKDICSLHDMCLKTIHLNLVSEWLQPDIVVDCNASLEDDSFSGMAFSSKKENNSSLNSCNADDNILRARYVMEYGDVQEWASFLINIVYGGEASVGMRLRAMQCLCMLADQETLEDLSGRTMPCIREKLRTLRFLRDLQILGLTYSESGFETCDKKELATVVLRGQTHSPRAVSFLVQLCMEYNVINMSIWNSILQQLVDLSMMKELEQALSYTLAMYQLWTVPNFRKAWDLLLTSPFLKASHKSEDNKETDMLHALALFPTCPVIKCIDVNASLEQCLTNQRPDIAALLLPYVENSEIPQWMEKILSFKKRDTIIEDIKKITSGRSINVLKVLSMFSSDSTS